MWNLTRQIMQRENGLTLYNGVLNQDPRSSNFFVQHIGLLEQNYNLSDIVISDFDLHGNYFCGFKYDALVIFDIINNNLIEIPLIEGKKAYFVEKEQNSQALEILTTDLDGVLQHTILRNTGDIVFSNTICLHDSVPIVQVLKVPFNANEIMCIDGRGVIYQIDLRCQNNKAFPTTCVFENGKYWTFVDCAAHHPINFDIALACMDNTLRIFDERNLKKCNYEPLKVHQLDGDEGFNYLRYNIDGRELLLQCSHGGIFLMRNQILENIPFYNFRGPLHIDFFGTNSEFIIGCCQEQCRKIVFYNKTKNIVKHLDLIENGRLDIASLKTHPKLPIIALSTRRNGGGICTFNGKSQFEKNDFDDDDISYSYDDLTDEFGGLYFD